jgi:nucleoside-diphosphate-sugar epimerase
MIILCADRRQSPNAANQVFFVADGQYLSTTELLIKVGQAAKCRVWLFPVPARLLRAIAVLIGNPGLANRLLDNLQVDTSKARLILGWKPVVSLEEQLAAMFDQDATSESKLNQKSIVLLMTLLKQLIKSCFVKVKLYCFDFKVN